MANYAEFSDAIQKAREDGIRTDQEAMSFIEITFLGKEVLIEFDMKEEAIRGFREDMVDTYWENYPVVSTVIRIEKDDLSYIAIYKWCEENCTPYLNLTELPYLKVTDRKIRFMLLMEPVCMCEDKELASV